MSVEGRASYSAFISYRHVSPDLQVAVQLQRRLESYRVPRALARALGVSTHLQRVFRDEEELPASPSLSEEIQEALRNAGALIVICSRQTPLSRWVDAEVRYFLDLDRGDRIFPVLIDGTPDESFPVPLLEWSRASRGGEPLAADLRPRPGERSAVRWRHAVLQLLAGLVGCGLDDLRRRELSRRRRRSALSAVALVGVVAAMFGYQHVVEQGRREAEERANVERYRKLARELASQATTQSAAHQHELAALLARQAAKYDVRSGQTAAEQVDRALREVMSVPVFANELQPGDGLELFRGALDKRGDLLAVGAVRGRIGDAASNPGAVLVWDLSRPGQHPAHRADTHAAVTWVGFGTNGRLVAALWDGTVLIWPGGIPDGSPAKLELSVRSVSALALSPDGRRLAAIGTDRRVRIWDLDSPKTEPLTLAAARSSGGISEEIIRAIEEREGKLTGSLYSLAFSLDGQFLAAGTNDRAVRVWNLSSPRSEPIQLPRGSAPARKSAGFGMYVNPVFRGDKAEIAFLGNHDGAVHFWDVAADKKLREPVRRELGRPFLIAFDQSSNWAAWVGAVATRTVQLGPPDLRNTIHRLEGHTAPITSLLFSDDGSRLVSVGHREARVWNLERQPTSAIFLQSPPPDPGLGDAGTQNMMRALMQGKMIPLTHRLGLSGDGTTLVSSPGLFGGAAVDVWSIDSSGRDPRMRRLQLPVAFGVFAPDARDGIVPTAVTSDGRLIAAALGSRVRIFHGNDLDRPPVVLSSPSGPASTLRFHPDGTRLAVSSGNSVWMWTLEPIADDASEPPVTTFTGSTAKVSQLAFSSDGSLLASAAADGKVMLWRTNEPNQAILQIEAHPGGAHAIAIHPNGDRIASGGADGLLRIHDTSGRNVATARFPGDAVQAIAYRADGRMIGVGTGTPAEAAKGPGGRKNPGGVFVIDSENLGMVPIRLDGPTSGVSDICYSDAGALAAAGDDRGVWIWHRSPDALPEDVCGLVRRNLTEAEWGSFVPELPYEKTCEHLP